jgi:hypothetical protein
MWKRKLPKYGYYKRERGEEENMDNSYL